MFVFAVALFMPTTLTAHAAERGREIVAVDSGNSLNMRISDMGLLMWDAVADATGYVISVAQNGKNIANFDTTNTVLMIVSELDGLKLDSGLYVIEVYAKGVAQRATMTYYYTSNVDKLEAPHGLQWIGNKAAWENVEGAAAYRLWLYSFSGEEFSIMTNENPYDLSAYSPQDGWTFKVQALGNGTLSSKRDSFAVESPAKDSRTRTISEIVTGNSLHMTLADTEVLSWDAVDGATGYRIAVKQNNMEVAYVETTYNFIALVSSLDGVKLDSARYVIEVEPQGVSANSASMSYYYTSHVDKLESPYNLHWNGTQACWNAVAGATIYDVTLFDFNGAVMTVPTEDDYYDFSGNSPEDGWTFKVQARSNGTLNAQRHSYAQESPAKETTYSIYCVVSENGTVSLTTNKGSQNGLSAILSATKGTEVTVSAVAEPGYEFVAWRLNTPSDPAATCSTVTTYTFDATSEIHIFAVFTDKYTVSYNGNGGGGVEMQGAVVNVGDTFALDDCTYTAPYGKDFKGWAVGSVDAWPLKQAGDTIEIHADTTIYAIWDNQYIIVHEPEDTNGKIGADIPVAVTIDLSQVPNDSNANIVLEVQNGGNLDQVTASDRGDWTGSFNVTSNTTGIKTYRYKVYNGTKWFTSNTFEVEFLPLVVTFVDNKHSTETDSISVDEYNTYITAPVIPTFAGDYFYTWRNINGSQEWDFVNDRVTQDVTLYADWAERGYYGNISDVYALVGAKARIDLSNVYSNNSYTYIYKYDGANWVQVENVTNYGWYDLAASAVAKSETYKIVIRHREDIDSNVFTVNWVEDVFTVSFNKNGGDGTMVNVEVVGVYKLPSCTFDAPAGHRFAGWAIGSVDALPLKEVGDQITISANTVVYAVWEEIPTYLVVYGPGEGQGSGDSDVVEEGTEYTVDSHEKFVYMVAPEGKRFAYWSVRIGSAMSEEVAQKQAGSKITITADTYLIAIWESKTVVGLQVEYADEYIEEGNTLDGGKLTITATYSDETQEVIAPLDVEYWYLGEKIDDPAGYVFDLIQTYDIVVVYKEAQADLSIDVVKIFAFQFDSNGGGSMDDVTAISRDGLTADYKLPACAFTAPEGQQFKSWQFELDGETVEYSPTDVVPLEDGTVIYAVWEEIPAETFTVSFNSNGGGGEMEDVTDVAGTYVLPDCAFTAPSGKKFKGWSDNANGPAFNSQAIVVDDNVTIYAIWENITHSHDFEAVAYKAPTCTVKGNIAYWHCTTCGKYFSDANGENEIGLEDTVLDEIAHTPVVDNGKAATCTESGLTDGSHCSVCETVLTAQEVIPALGHDWGEWTIAIPAEVGVKGVETRVCKRDPEHTETREISALPYGYKSVDGVRVYEFEFAQGQAQDVSGLFAEAKAQNGKVEVTVGTLTITFDENAVNAVGGNSVTFTASVVTENLTIDGAQLAIEVSLAGATFGSGKATLSVPFTTAVPSGKVAKVYYVNGNDKEDMNAIFSDGRATFDTTHFSTFAVVFENEQTAPVDPVNPDPVNPDPVDPQPSNPEVNPTPEKKGLSGGAIAGIVIAIVVVLAGAGVGVFFLLKKKGAVGDKKTDEIKKEDEIEDGSNE